MEDFLGPASLGEKSAEEIRIHNMYINEMISSCRKKKEKYQQALKEAGSIANEISELEKELQDCNELLQKIVVSNEPVGKDELLKTSSSAENIRKTFSDVALLCEQKKGNLDNEINTLKEEYW